MRFLLSFFCFLVIHSLFGQSIPLEWKFYHPIKNQWFNFGQKGSIQERLIELGELPDPMIGKNEELFAWVEKEKWILESRFTLTEDQLKTTFIELELPNIDTYADVFINGIAIGKTENTFFTYRFDVNTELKIGENVIELDFRSPVAEKTWDFKNSIPMPSPNDLGNPSIASFCRKPQYQFGWDWTLRMQTIGMWSPAKLHFFSQNRLLSAQVQTDTITSEKALVTFTIELANRNQDSLVWISALYGKEVVVIEEGLIKRSVSIKNPVLWWPRGHGKPFIYQDHWMIYSKNGKLIGEVNQNFGVRKTELNQRPDKFGTPFELKINDKQVFVKGANMIPPSIFPASVTDEQLRAMVNEMVASNFNCVRVWGGGYYLPESFYQACDEKGLMVWQDFMFACAMYPGDDAFFETVQMEMNQQIPRLASHPSVVLFNGNNEVDVAWKNWGFQKQFNISSKDSITISDNYKRLFQELIPKTVTQFTNTPYVHTSPLSNWGKDEGFKHGTMHYWGVWHGADEVSALGKKLGRFNTEYGFQSFPEYSTLLKFSNESDWSLDSPTMKHHQKSYVGNQMIARHADKLYGKTDDFKQFVYQSQLTQRDAVRLAIANHRSESPKCSGTIFWQYNDCWPAPTWSSVDYYGNWKALQYAVKEDYEDVTIVNRSLFNQPFSLQLVNDLYKQDTFSVEIELLNLKGEKITSFLDTMVVSEPATCALFPGELMRYGNQNYVAKCTLSKANGLKVERTFKQLIIPYKVADSKSVNISIQSVDPTNKVVTIRLENSEFLSDVWLYSLKSGMKFNRNFVDLLPGKHVFQVHFEELPSIKDFNLKWK